jgi:hypothetical protein
MMNIRCFFFCLSENRPFIHVCHHTIQYYNSYRVVVVEESTVTVVESCLFQFSDDGQYFTYLALMLYPP